MIYYTYAWLREDKTPYYIGKGCKKRAWRKGSPPKDRVLILKKNLTEQEAFKHEKYMIAVFGRRDLGTGILHNFTDGGDGISGLVHSGEAKQKISDARKGKPHSDETKQKISETTKGRIVSDETKQKMSEAAKRTVRTDEDKQCISAKLSELQKGRRLYHNTVTGQNKKFHERPDETWVLGRVAK